METSSRSFRHITLFKLYETTDQETRDKILRDLRSIGADDPRILEWRVELSLDERKGYIIVENGLFRSRDDFEDWRQSEKHRTVAQSIRTAADWWIGDYLEESK